MQWNIGLDIGGWGVRMAVRGRGVALRQSAAVAVRARSGDFVALGDEALSYLGRAPRTLDVGFPMNAGQIAREELLRIWTEYLFSQSAVAGMVHRARVLIARDGMLSPSQKKRLAALAMESGASACALVDADMACALGAGLPVDQPRASLMVDVGATRVSAALIALGRVVRRETLPYGMARADEAIVRALRAQGFCIGLRSAEELKLTLAAALGENKISAPVRGLDAQTGFPCVREIDAAVVSEAVSPIAQAVVQLVERTVEGAPEELAADLTLSGLVLTGGGAQLFGLDKRIAAATGLECRVAEDPAACAVRGLEAMLEEGERYAALTEAHTSLLRA